MHGIFEVSQRFRLQAATLALCVGVSLLAWSPAAQAKRLALVIGNGAYSNTEQLTNPQRDADSITEKLKTLSFQVVAAKDVGGDSMRAQITSFKRLVGEGDTVVIYYAGHGMEVNGRDYLLPVNADIRSAGDVVDWGYPLNNLFFTDMRNVSVIVVFDACRDNTFLRNTHSNTVGTSAITVPSGDMVIFSASSGEVALDGDPGKNSVFADAMLGALSATNLDDRDLFVEVRRQVEQQTKDAQHPQIIGALNQKFLFNQAYGANGSAAVAAVAPPPASPSPASAPPTPVQVAAITPSPDAPQTRSLPRMTSDAPAPALASAPVVERANPLQPGSYTIASLGMNRMPSRPDLATIPPVPLPARFCSAEERNAFHDKVYQPAVEIAANDNTQAKGYLEALNGLHHEYSDKGSGYANAIVSESLAYQTIAADAFAKSGAYVRMFDALMAVPVGGCK